MMKLVKEKATKVVEPAIAVQCVNRGMEGDHRGERTEMGDLNHLRMALRTEIISTMTATQRFKL